MDSKTPAAVKAGHRTQMSGGGTQGVLSGERRGTHPHNMQHIPQRILPDPIEPPQGPGLHSAWG